LRHKPFSDHAHTPKDMKNWTIGKRITLGFAAVIGCVLVIGGFSLFKFQSVRADAAVIAKDTIPSKARVNRRRRSRRPARRWRRSPA
jgi:hypothetical protein